MRVNAAALCVVALAACGGNDTGKPVDAKPIDGTVNTKVVTTDCATSTPAATVMTTDAVNMYMPMATTITMGQVVKFITSATHDVNPNPIGTSDPGLKVGFSMTKCLRFTETGTFGFFCSNHSFAGTITVN